MIEVSGRYNTAKIFIDKIDNGVRSQIEDLCNLEFFNGCKIRIMPDTHQGVGCTIGTTMTISNKVVPNMVGVDIGCGMETAILEDKNINLNELDKFIKYAIPAGMNIRKNPHKYSELISLENLRCFKYVKEHRAYHSIGTLGGGNHFIECGKDDSGTIFIIIHSGSRHLGTEVAGWYQNEGYKNLSGNSKKQIKETIEYLKAQRRKSEIQATIKKLQSQSSDQNIPEKFAYVEGQLFDDYIHDMKLTQNFAAVNRKAILDDIVKAMGLTVKETITTIHNYIDTDAMILRKGAVSAKKGEKLLIPINMRDGSLLCTGKGCEDWNFSAPHGAGRLMSRAQAFKTYTLDEFKQSMEGIYSTTVNNATLDECPMVYKNMADIVDNIVPTVHIDTVIKPIYNFKAG